jgi:hypothetical protein
MGTCDLQLHQTTPTTSNSNSRQWSRSLKKKVKESILERSVPMAMECDGIEVAKIRKEIVMEWNAMVMKVKEQKNKLQWSGMRW